MLMTDDKARIEYEALLRLARDTERMTFLAWLIPGVTASALLAWGIGTRHPGFMVAVVLTCAIGLLATSRWRERAGSIAGYVETYYESEGENPSYYNRRARLEATLGSGGREWHVVTFFNGVAVAASVFAWMSSSNADHGELWAGVVTGCTLALASYSVSETTRALQSDPSAAWRRADGGLREVKRSSLGRSTSPQ